MVVGTGPGWGGSRAGRQVGPEAGGAGISVHCSLSYTVLGTAGSRDIWQVQVGGGRWSRQGCPGRGVQGGVSRQGQLTVWW